MPLASADDLDQRAKQFGLTETAAPPVPASTMPAQLSQAPDRTKALSEAGIKLVTPALASDKVDWKDEKLSFQQRFSAALNDLPPEMRDKISIESGYRTDKEQAEIYARSEQGKKFMAAPPGKSLHEQGLAADITFSDKAAEKAFREAVTRHGLEFPFPDRDPNHLQIVGAQRLTSEVQQKRVGTADELDARAAQFIHGTPSQDYAEEQPDERFVDPLDQSPSDTSEEAGALLAGSARGVVGLVTGPVQATLEQTSPENAVKFTNQINDWEERLGIVEAARKHPMWTSAGEVVGTVAAVMVTGGLLGDTAVGEAVGKVASYVPRALRGVTLGGVTGATTYHQSTDEGNRWLEGALGAVFGGVGQTIGSTLGWGTRYLANREAFNKYLAVLQGSVGEWNRNLSKIKDEFLEHYRGLTEEANRLYEVRNQSGKAFPGFDAERLSRGVSAAIPKEAREVGVATTVTTNKVKDELGLYAHEASKRAHAEAVKEWEGAEAKWQKAAAGLKYGGVPITEMSQAVREKLIQEAGSALPPRPLPPGEFVPKPVTANRFAAALQAVHRAREAARDPQTRHQLSTLEKELFNAAKEAAEQHGMPVEQFLRDMVRANKFFAENIGPIRDMFKKMTPDRVARKYTTVEMANEVSRILKENNVELMEKLGKALGPRAKVEATKVVMKDMLDRLTDGMKGQVPTQAAVGRFSEYVRDRKEGLQALLGRQHVEELEGVAKLGEQLMTAKPKSRLWGWGTHSFLPFIGAEQVFEGVWEGDLHKVQRGSALIAAPFAVHALHDTMIKMYELPYMLPMVRAAAKLKPGSSEFERLVRQIEARAIGVGAVIGRETPQVVDTLIETP